MKKNGLNYLMLLAGLILFGIGLYLVKNFTDPQGVMRAIPYICIGIGCGIFASGLGHIIGNRALNNNPELAKQIEISTNDERNIYISDRAKAKAYDLMIFVFGVLILLFALMGIDRMAILLFVGAYLFVIGWGIYCRFKYNMEM